MAAPGVPALHPLPQHHLQSAHADRPRPQDHHDRLPVRPGRLRAGLLGNPLALLNAVAALETVHGTYLEPNGNDGDSPGALAYGYTPPGYVGPNANPLKDQLNCTTHEANCRYDGPNKTGNTYITIPATSLPMYDFVLNALPAALRPLVKPFVDLVSPVTKVLVDLGYDFSGNPGVPTPLSILPFNPFQNWLSVGVNLIGASIQGVQAFVGDLGKLGSSVTTLVPNTVSVNQIQPKKAFSRLASGGVQGDSPGTVENNDQQDAVVEGLVDETAVGDDTVGQNEIDQNKIDQNQSNKSDQDAAAKVDAAAEAEAAAKTVRRRRTRTPRLLRRRRTRTRRPPRRPPTRLLLQRGQKPMPRLLLTLRRRTPQRRPRTTPPTRHGTKRLTTSRP